MSRTREPGIAAPRLSSRGVLATVSTVLALLLAEMLARWLGIDQRLLTAALFFQGADVEVHRVSADPALHYELAPGTSCDCAIGGPTYRVTIDEHGARHPSHPIAKAAGVYRIMCVGGSTVYGGAVDDAETIPAALERQLNAGTSTTRRYEAWNFGTSAYMLRQAAHLASTRLDDVRPDLVLVQLFNQGRRAFLMPPSNDALDYDWAALLADPDFFTEQFALPSWFPPELDPLLRRSALARTAVGVAPGFGPNLRCGWCTERDRAAARALSTAAEARGIPVVYYAIPATRCGPDGKPEPHRPSPGAGSVYPSLDPTRFVDLFEADREPAFYEVHPPPPILEEYARLLIAALRGRGLLEPM